MNLMHRAPSGFALSLVSNATDAAEKAALCAWMFAVSFAALAIRLALTPIHNVINIARTAAKAVTISERLPQLERNNCALSVFNEIEARDRAPSKLRAAASMMIYMPMPAKKRFRTEAFTV